MLFRSLKENATDGFLEPALRWSLERITGKPVEPPKVVPSYESLGPLEPILNTP